MWYTEGRGAGGPWQVPWPLGRQRTFGRAVQREVPGPCGTGIQTPGPKKAEPASPQQQRARAQGFAGMTTLPVSPPRKHGGRASLLSNFL